MSTCLGHLQNGCEAMADSLLVLVPYKQKNIASSILKQIGILSPDGSKARAVEKRHEAHRQQLECCKGYTDRDGTGGWV